MKLKINIKNPIISSLLCLLITFIIALVVLSIVKPSYVIEISNKGVKNVNKYLLVSISLLFGVLMGIAKLLFFYSRSEKLLSQKLIKNNFAFNPNVYAYRP